MPAAMPLSILKDACPRKHLVDLPNRNREGQAEMMLNFV